MLIEKTIEAQIAAAIGGLTDLSDAFVIASRSATAAGAVKGTVNPSSPQIVAVSLGLRSYDSFSLPTVNISGSVALTTRAELCPTGEEHETALDALTNLFTGWHENGQQMTSALSVTGKFFAAELRMDGGDGKSYDQANGAWYETFSFTIRGTLLGSNN